MGAVISSLDSELGVGTTVKLYLPKSSDRPIMPEAGTESASLRPRRKPGSGQCGDVPARAQAYIAAGDRVFPGTCELVSEMPNSLLAGKIQGISGIM
jgi:hypothetical protein